MIRRLNFALLWLVAAGVAYVFAAAVNRTHGFGVDAHAYWATGQPGPLYDAGPAHLDAYLYSPAFAQIIWPLTLLPFAVFYALWAGMETVALWWLTRPLPVRWRVPVIALCLPEVFIGNIYLLLAAMCVLSVRYPGVWAFGVLTKITPGVGAVWFVVRGEWRNLMIAVTSTVAVVVVSVAVSPDWWGDYARFLYDHAGDGDPTFPYRCAAAFAVVVYAARPDRRWLIPVAVLAANPVTNAWACAMILAAIPRLTQSPGSVPSPDPRRLESV